MSNGAHASRVSTGSRRRAARSCCACTPICRQQDMQTLDGGGIDTATADRVVENAVGVYALPLGVGLNFVINGRDVLVPMAVEEPSVIAAASNAARMVREGGGFVAEADDPVMTAQIEIVGVDDPDGARKRAWRRPATSCSRWRTRRCRASPIAAAARARSRCARHPGAPDRARAHRLPRRDGRQHGQHRRRGAGRAGGARWRAGGPGLRILTNLCDRRRVRVQARVPAAALATEALDGAAVRDGIVAASRFAEDDPYRAATHNKGIMNGVDAVVIATGNDWRGVEAGAHAFAAADGRYRPLAVWRERRRRPRRPARDADGGRHRRRHAARARGRAARAAAAGRHRREGAGDVDRQRRAGVEPGGAARAGHRRHPARPHGAAPQGRSRVAGAATGSRRRKGGRT